MRVEMSEAQTESCGKCVAEIELSRRVDFTLKNGTRVCDSCFVKETPRPTQPARDRSNWKLTFHSRGCVRGAEASRFLVRIGTVASNTVFFEPLEYARSAVSIATSAFLLFRTSTRSVYRLTRLDEHSLCRSPIWPGLTGGICIRSPT